MDILIKEAANLIIKSNATIAFMGAGISAESGPPFLGEYGLWNKYDPKVLDVEYYFENEEKCWFYLREIFYDFFCQCKTQQSAFGLFPYVKINVKSFS